MAGWTRFLSISTNKLNGQNKLPQCRILHGSKMIDRLEVGLELH